MRYPPRFAMRSRYNPRIGYHPDLFGGHDTAVIRPLAELTDKQLEQLTPADVADLKRDDFTDDEWDDVPEEVAEAIYEQDPISKARIAGLVTAFVEQYKWASEPEANEAIESVQDYFSSWLSDEDENLVAKGGGDAEELIEEFVAEGWAQTDVEGALTQAMQDDGNYVFDTTTNEYGRGNFFMERASTGGLYIERGDLDVLLEGMHEDEIEIALEEINKETYLHIKRDDLDAKYGVDKEVECDVYVTAEPGWDSIRKAVKEALADIEKGGEEEARPIADRTIYTFPDRAYVLDLLPSELAAEGDALGICVGKAQYGYASAVRAGKTKILSLRTPSGRPRFTIEADMDPSTGDVRRIRQIKGKANRLASKGDEVQKLVLLMEHLGVDPESVHDLQPGLRALTEGTPVRENPAARHWHCGFCRAAATRGRAAKGK